MIIILIHISLFSSLHVHFSAPSFISIYSFTGEGWPLIDQLEDACVPPVDGIYQPGVPLPVVVHYCQNFRAGLLGFAKRQVHRDIFTCEHPLFIEPPLDLSSTDFRI